MKNNLIPLKYAVATLICAAVLTSCGGNGEGSDANNSTHEGGLAPAHINGDVLLSPTDATATGIIRLTDTDARVATFTTPMAGTFTGNYTYTKCGADLAELKLDNLRTSPIQAPADQHWTIIGHLTFVGENKVVFTGVETFVATGGEAGPNVQGPMGSENFSLNYTFTMEGAQP